MYFLIECDELWENFNAFKVNQYLKRTWLGTHLKKKLLKTKIRSCGDEVTYFPDKERSKAGSNYICFAAILIGFVPKKMETITHKCF